MKLIPITLVAVVVGMMVACSSEPVATPTPDGPKYTDSQVLQVLENYARNTTHPSYFNNCWREGMKDLEYAVGRRTSDSNAFDVTGKGKFVDGTPYTMTWVVRMEANTSTYKHTGSGFVTKPAGQVTRTHVLTHC